MPHNAPLAALPLGSTIGILGGGQLGRYLAIAAAKLGLRSFVFAPEEDACAFQVSSGHMVGVYDDEAALATFAKSCAVVTFEFENVPAQALAFIERFCEVHPRPMAAQATQDRRSEKNLLSKLKLPLAPYCLVEGPDDLKSAAAFLAHNGKAILKRARHGYDGKGQAVVSSAFELEGAFAEFGGPCVLEAFVPFEAETSVIAARAPTGEMVFYDMPKNTHEAGVLRRCDVPYAEAPALAAAARTIVRAIAQHFHYVGVLAVEFFVVRNEGGAPALLVNEIAPRVHNSGHWTLDACAISQFENHIRAIAGWPLGDPSRHSDAVMMNLLGRDLCRWHDVISDDPAACLHIYGKAGVTFGRKLGHITWLQKLCR